MTWSIILFNLVLMLLRFVKYICTFLYREYFANFESLHIIIIFNIIIINYLVSGYVGEETQVS